MKFRDGMWLVASDKRVEYAEDIYTINERESGLNLLCPTRPIKSRGDTLNISTIGIDVEAAFDGVISVEVTHWNGARRPSPDFELFPTGKPSFESKVEGSGSSKTVVSGALSATVTARTFEIKFHETSSGRAITSLLNRSVGLAYSPGFMNPKITEDDSNFKHYMFTQTELGVGETIHGLGERFGAFNKVGQTVVVWNDDGGTSSEQAYKNVPFLMSSAGYGIFIDTPDRVELEIGSERSCRLQTSVEGQRLKWYLIYGPTPKEVLTKYSILTGKANMVPAWSFGLWLTTSFTTSYDESTVNSFLEGMRSRDISLEVFHFDCFWLRAFHWCDFVFSPEHFPDPKGQIQRLKESKLANKVCVWINPYLAQASPVFTHAAEKGYLLKRPNGDVWQWDLWTNGMGIVDLTNPEAVKWYVECLEGLFDIGIDCIKTDFGERIPTSGVVWHDKTVDNSRMHNYYAFIYNKIVYEAVERRYGKNNAVLFARSATAGSQRFPLVWGGDCESTYAAMAESIRGGLSLGLSGFSFWSNDIGGFEGSPDPGIYKRWVAFGLLCSHSRLHGSDSYRVPWLIDDDSKGPESCTEILRDFVRLKRSLMPYLYAQAVESAAKGWPLSVRAMGLEFPDDPTCWFVDTQFMVGSSLLVAPVMNSEGRARVYLPPGTWISWWDGAVVEGPKWRNEQHSFKTLPIYVREGSVILVAKEHTGESFDFDWIGQGGEVRSYSRNGSGSAIVVDRTGATKGTLTVSEGSIAESAGLGDTWQVRQMINEDKFRKVGTAYLVQHDS